LVTITGDYFVHPTEDRMIGMNELKHFNSFPVDYEFESHPRYWPSLIARGVAPRVAEYLASALKSSVRGKPTSSGDPSAGRSRTIKPHPRSSVSFINPRHNLTKEFITL
jgi:hypothetical protein